LAADRKRAARPAAGNCSRARGARASFQTAAGRHAHTLRRALQRRRVGLSASGHVFRPSSPRPRQQTGTRLKASVQSAFFLLSPGSIHPRKKKPAQSRRGGASLPLPVGARPSLTENACTSSFQRPNEKASLLSLSSWSAGLCLAPVGRSDHSTPKTPDPWPSPTLPRSHPSPLVSPQIRRSLFEIKADSQSQRQPALRPRPSSFFERPLIAHPARCTATSAGTQREAREAGQSRFGFRRLETCFFFSVGQHNPGAPAVERPRRP